MRLFSRRKPNKEMPPRPITFESIFDSFYKKACEVMTDYKNAKTELLPLFYLICDFAVCEAQQDRKYYMLRMQNAISVPLLRDLDDPFAWLDGRTELYANVLNGMTPLRMEWFAGDPQALPSDLRNDPIFVCNSVFCDFMVNPYCAENYENSPIYIRGIDKMVALADKAKALYACMTQYFTAIYEWCKANQP